jgi:hypothetical protein
MFLGDKDNIGVPPPRGVKAGLAAIGSQTDRIGQCPTSVCLQLRSNILMGGAVQFFVRILSITRSSNRSREVMDSSHSSRLR